MAATVVREGAKVPDGYAIADAAILSNLNLMPLWIEAGIQYWGYL